MRPERIRVIPTLLLKGEGLVKTVRFRNPVYVGDAVNTVKIFNEKEVDEIVILDIEATRSGREPQFDRVKEIASEAFMPLAYGGGISTLDQAKRLFQSGIEKLVVNTSLHESPELISECATQFGSQSVVASLDAKRGWIRAYRVWTRCGTQRAVGSPADAAKRAVELGAGEVMINSIDRDGTFRGYDTELVMQVTRAISVPVIACGGAGSVEDFVNVVRDGGASAVAAGSMFVFHGVHRAVLINFPSEQVLTEKFFDVCHDAKA